MDVLSVPEPRVTGEDPLDPDVEFHGPGQLTMAGEDYLPPLTCCRLQSTVVC